MALATAAGPISTVEELLATTIANATYFLTFTGEADASAATNRIYYGALPVGANGAETVSLAEWQRYRPYAMVAASPIDTMRFSRVGSGNTYLLGGTMFALFERDAPLSMTLEEADRDWKNVIGKLLKQTDESDPFDGILDLADTADRLTVQRCAINEIYRAGEEEVTSAGDYQRAVVQFDWGAVE